MLEFIEILREAAADKAEAGEMKFDVYSPEYDRLSEEILQIAKCEFCKNNVEFKIETDDAIGNATFRLADAVSKSAFQAGFNVAVALFCSSNYSIGGTALVHSQ